MEDRLYSIRKSITKSFINKLSDRLQKLEVDRAIAAPAGEEASDYGVIDPEISELQIKYSKLTGPIAISINS